MGSRWWERAACDGMPTDMWFPNSGYTTFARDICNGCPVRMECLEYAMQYPELEGMWGGLDSTQRARLRLRRAS